MGRLKFEERVNKLPKKCISSVKDTKSDYKGRVTTPFPLTDFTLTVIKDNGKRFIILEVKDNG